ncbi:MAG: GntR family transcriptional regulator [Candidatus Acidiferrales bacterium]
MLPLARKPLGDEVYSILRRMIIRRDLQPGSRITENEIAESLGVSRTPVREAFQRLAYDELLILQPGRSPQVRPITLHNIDEAYPLIAVLEGLAIRLACRRLTETDLRHMEDLTGEMERCGRAGDTESLMRADNDFHGVLHERAANSRLHGVVADLRRRLERLEFVFFSTPAAVKGSVKRHRWRVKVLRKRDPREAQKALEYTWGVGQQSVRQLVADLQIATVEQDWAEAVTESVRPSIGATSRKRPGLVLRQTGTSNGGFSRSIRLGGV